MADEKFGILAYAAADCRRLMVFARPAPALARSQRVPTILTNCVAVGTPKFTMRYHAISSELKAVDEG